MQLLGVAWNQDRMDGQYYIWLNNGDAIGFDAHMEEFSLNNYWNVIDSNVVETLLKQVGKDDDL